MNYLSQWPFTKSLQILQILFKIACHVGDFKKCLVDTYPFINSRRASLCIPMNNGMPDTTNMNSKKNCF